MRHLSRVSRQSNSLLLTEYSLKPKKLVPESARSHYTFEPFSSGRTETVSHKTILSSRRPSTPSQIKTVYRVPRSFNVNETIGKSTKRNY